MITLYFERIYSLLISGFYLISTHKDVKPSFQLELITFANAEKHCRSQLGTRGISNRGILISNRKC